MKTLSQAGLLLIASIHQPRYSAYLQFDRLLLLSKGKLIYGGACGTSSVESRASSSTGMLPLVRNQSALPSEPEQHGDAVMYFQTLGFMLPRRQNPADFFIEICFGFVSSKTTSVDGAHWPRHGNG